MKKKDVEKLERCISQVDALHKEVSVLSKKSPNDAVSPFKLKFINSTLEEVNGILEDRLKPFKEFTVFEDESAPTTSDVVFMLAQYAEALELYRSENIKQRYGGGWLYDVEDPDMDEEGNSEIIKTRAPASLNKKG